MATQISREICDVMWKRSIGPMQTTEARLVQHAPAS